MNRILLVDDEENVLRALCRLLERSTGLPPLEIECFIDPVSAIERIREQAFDLIISDYRMAPLDGVAVLSAARESQPEAIRIILSAQADMSALVRAINDAQIFRFLSKPWNAEDIVRSVAESLEARRLALESVELADAQRVQRGVLSPSDQALRQLERESPGISKVRWGPDGEVLLDEDAGDSGG